MMMLHLAASGMMADNHTPLTTGLDRSNMDLSVRPGDDFFQFAAGGWMKSHPLTPEFSRFTQFEALQETNREQLRKLIEAAAESGRASSDDPGVGSLYRLAMDSTRRNAEGAAPIRSLLDRVSAITERRSIGSFIGRLADKGISAFFKVGCDADLRDADWNLLQIGQGSLTMGERDYYLSDDEATVKVRDAYKQYIQQLFLLTGCDEAAAKTAMEGVVEIETRMAQASYSATRLRDVEGNYHKMSYDSLLVNYPGIDWSTYLLQTGIPAVDAVSVGQPEPIHEVERILAEAPLESLKSYLRFLIIDDATDMLSDDFRAAAFAFYGTAMSGAEQDRPRWKRAVSAVDGALGMAVGRMYVAQYFPESSKQRMLELVQQLQQAFSERIEEQKWMSERTKQSAREKLQAFYVKIGYPDEWMNYDGLNIDETLSYYENRKRITQFMSRYYIRKRVGQRVDRAEWLMTPQTINAYYNPTTNEICFPAAILQPPFFNAEADDACNYGAIGVVIGHEMTHGFDDQGSQFDKDGNLRRWWTDEDTKAFRTRTAVMADFFDAIEVLPGLHANGHLTLGENIADHGGLNIAFQAFKNATARNPLSTVDGFTPEQRFFLSYGLIWGNNIREASLRMLTKIDPHSAGRWRVNGALPHIDAWYKAWGITSKDALYVPKKKRVDIW